MHSVLQDLRYALRNLVNRPGFTAVVIVTLALGIGASTAIFSVVNGVLLRPLPYKDSEELVLLWTHAPGREAGKGWVSRGLYGAIRDQNQVFEGIALLDGHSSVFSGEGAPERVRGVTGSASCLSLLGAKPALGRLFAIGEDEVSKPRSLVLSHALWTRKFGADPAVIGTNIRLDDGDYTVIGVLEEGFSLTREHLPMIVRADYWVLIPLGPGELQDHTHCWYGMIAKRGDGVTLAKAQAGIQTIAARLRQDMPGRYPPESGFTVEVVPFIDHVVGEVRPALWLLFGAVGLVMLLVCTNVANLVLAQATARQHEIGIRAALGARRVHIVRQLLVESVLLSLLGGALGLLLASWGLPLLLHVGAKAIPRVDEIGIAPSAVVFTLGLSLLTSAVFGLVPALTASKVDLNGVLRQSDRSVSGAGSFKSLPHHLRRSLVVGEIAVSFVLLIGAALLVRSFCRLQKVDAGFAAEKVLSFQVAAHGRKYPDSASVRRFYDQVHNRVASLPGIESAGGISIVPFGPNYSTNAVQAEDRPGDANATGTTVESRAVMWDYFETMEIPLLAGRHFNDHDTTEATPVAIVDERFAKSFWPLTNPIGKRFRIVDSPDFWMTIVGIVGTTKQYDLADEPRMAFFQPHSQCPWQYMYILARTTSDPGAATAAIASEIWAVDPDLPLMRVATMKERVAGSLAQRRFLLLLLGVFSGVALLLSIVGLYGVMAFLVGQSTHEIGVRMALGARRADVLRLVLQDGLALTAIGLAVGLVLSLAGARVLSSMLYETGATDPATFVGVSLLLVVVASLACYIPARRATKVDPMIALRCE